MVLSVKHGFESQLLDNPIDAAAGKVTPSRWNADHVVSGTLPSSQFAPYEHSQGAAISVWVVAHNLGRRPIVKIRSVGGVTLTDPEVRHLSENTLEVEFDVPFAGFATLT